MEPAISNLGDIMEKIRTSLRAERVLVSKPFYRDAYYYRRDNFPFNPFKEKTKMKVTLNVASLLAAIQAKAESNKAKHQQQLDTYETKRAEFTELARSNKLGESSVNAALNALGISQPWSPPKTFASQIAVLQMVEGSTIEIDSEDDTHFGAFFSSL